MILEKNEGETRLRQIASQRKTYQFEKAHKLLFANIFKSSRRRTNFKTQYRITFLVIQQLLLIIIS
jgi:hypothetical protein